jgi:3-hydroxyisobutyrate dehydrogenase-like beta-hydroxyacid dehydrogenase
MKGNDMKIGFLGLGIMGQGMARNLALKGHDVTAWNRTTKTELKEKLPKVKLVSVIRDAVVDQEIVMICVTGPDAQKDIYYGDEGLFAHVTPGTLVLDLTTTDPALARKLADEAKQRRLEYADCPVFGSRDEAWNGKLDIVWGGSDQVGKRAQAVFQAIAKSVHHMGETGAGAAMKLIGNNIVAAEFIALAEGLALARRSGVKLDAVPGVLMDVDYGSGLLVGNATSSIKGDYTPFFYLKHMLKDTRLVGDFAREANVPVYSGGTASQVFQAAANQGLGEENVSAVIKHVESVSK